MAEVVSGTNGATDAGNSHADETTDAGSGPGRLGGLHVARGAANAKIEEAVARFADGAPVTEGDIHIEIADVAENGANVPVAVEAPGAVAITLAGPGNMQPEIFTVTFGPLAGTQRLSTRIRLADSQEVRALARMADGSIIQARKQVHVTVGGCVA